MGVKQQKTTSKRLGYFLYMYFPFTGIHKGSVVDPDPDSALYLNAGLGSGFRGQSNADPCGFGSVIIRILVRICRHKKLYLNMKIILYIGNKSYLRIYKGLFEGWNLGLLV
jgi:hypothetical protein